LNLHFGDEIWFLSPNVMNMVPKMLVSWFFRDFRRLMYAFFKI
jgi:hypothetical protein